MLLFPSLDAVACNIPVFRYALERWHPDPVQLLVASSQDLGLTEKQVLRTLETRQPTDERAQSSATKAPANSSNAKVSLVNPKDTQLEPELQQALESLSPDSPNLLLTSDWKERRRAIWSGPLSEARAARLLDSPKRAELYQRLLNGDAIVWLMLQSPDADANEKVRKTLQATWTNLSKTLRLPDGIGQPGSELYADVPLALDFSTLEIDPQDQRETYLIELLKRFEPKAVASGQPVLAPVFGRGRVLEVLPAERVNEKLVTELTTFLSGACSCKVKGLNPGFDLLMKANWDVDLFGEDGERPKADGGVEETPLPTLISIPPGRKKGR